MGIKTYGALASTLNDFILGRSYNSGRLVLFLICIVKEQHGDHHQQLSQFLSRVMHRICQLTWTSFGALSITKLQFKNTSMSGSSKTMMGKRKLFLEVWKRGVASDLKTRKSKSTQSFLVPKRKQMSAFVCMCIMPAEMGTKQYSLILLIPMFLCVCSTTCRKHGILINCT